VPDIRVLDAHSLPDNETSIFMTAPVLVTVTALRERVSIEEATRLFEAGGADDGVIAEKRELELEAEVVTVVDLDEGWVGTPELFELRARRPSQSS
jgi:hypothetical protein